MKNDLLVDASVIANLFLSTNSESKQALGKKLMESKLYSISHLPFEVNNAIGKTVRKDLIKRIDYYYQVTQLPITYISPTDEDFRLAHFISMTLDESFYDSCYHAVAIMRGYTFLTYDKKYFRKGEQFKLIELVS